MELITNLAIVLLLGLRSIISSPAWLQAIAAILTLLAIVILTLFSVSNQRELTKKSIQAQENMAETSIKAQEDFAKNQYFLFATQSILKEIGDRDIRKARGRIVKAEASEKIKQKGVSLKKSDDPADRELADDVEVVSVSFDRIGFLVHGNKDLQWRILDFIGFSLNKMWDICEKFIDEFNKEYHLSNNTILPSYRYFREMATVYKENKNSIHEKAWKERI